MTQRTKLFKKLWKSGVTTDRIAEAIGVSQRHVRRIRQDLGLAPRTAGRPRAER
jgi:hypothetical protein